MTKFVRYVLILFVASCVSKPYESPKDSLTIMTYNVENLFDTVDDPEKNDEEYLPLAVKRNPRHRMKCQQNKKDHHREKCMTVDWSDTKVRRKMKRLKDVILQVKDGKGPDILIVQEVENLQILEKLRKEYLSEAGYIKAILIEGPDKRGIDVGMLSKLPIKGKPKLLEVDLSEAAKEADRKEVWPTRGILQAQFQLPNNQSLTVFGVHFPSQGSPTPYRRAALNRLETARKELPKTELVIAAGDFNITAAEGAQEGLFSDLSKNWLISHEIGCERCQGTHNYRGDWSFLDIMLFSKNFMEESWRVLPESVRVPNRSIYQMDHWSGPARFRGGISQKGVSDHWPLAADIKLKKEVKK